jgi:hypothetical protein
MAACSNVCVYGWVCVWVSMVISMQTAGELGCVYHGA